MAFFKGKSVFKRDFQLSLLFFPLVKINGFDCIVLFLRFLQLLFGLIKSLLSSHDNFRLLDQAFLLLFDEGRTLREMVEKHIITFHAIFKNSFFCIRRNITRVNRKKPSKNIFQRQAYHFPIFPVGCNCGA